MLSVGVLNVQPLLQSHYYNGSLLDGHLSKVPLIMGNMDPSYTWFLGFTRRTLKRHIDRFSRFIWLTNMINRQTDRQTTLLRVQQ